MKWLSPFFQWVALHWVISWFAGVVLLTVLLILLNKIKVFEDKVNSDFVVTEFKRDMKDLDFIWPSSKLHGLFFFPTPEVQYLISRIKDLKLIPKYSRQIIKTEGVDFPTKQDEERAERLLESQKQFAVFWGHVFKGESSVWITYKAYNRLVKTPDNKFPNDIIRFHTQNLDSVITELDPCLRLFEHMKRSSYILENPDSIKECDQWLELINELKIIDSNKKNSCTLGLKEALLAKYEWLLYRCDPEKNKEYLDSSYDRIKSSNKEIKSHHGEFSEGILLVEKEKYENAIKKFQQCIDEKRFTNIKLNADVYHWLGYANALYSDKIKNPEKKLNALIG
jgi:tetratricopeptide (TPR) repeat protein